MDTAAKLKKKPLIIKLISGGVWVFAGRLTMSVTTLAITALLARTLDVDAVGAYFLAVSVVLVFSLLAQFGMERTVVRFVSEAVSIKRPDLAALILRRIFLFAFGTSLAVMTLFATGGGRWLIDYLFHSQPLNTVSLLIGIWVVLVTFQKLVSESFRGYANIAAATLFGGPLGNLVTICLLFYLWSRNYVTLSGVIMCVVAGLIINLFFATAILVKSELLHSNAESDQLYDGNCNAIFKVSAPLLVVNFSVFFLSQADLWVLGIFRPGEDVALYGAALRLIVFVGMPLMMVNSVVQPWIARLYKVGDRQELEHLLRTAALVAGVPCLIVFFALLFFGEWMLGALFGNLYQQAFPVLVLLAVGRLVQVCTGSCGMVLAMTGHQMDMMKISIFSGMMMLVLLYFGVVQWGMVGCALAATLAISTQNIILLLVAKKRTGIWTCLTLRPDWYLLANLKG